MIPLLFALSILTTSALPDKPNIVYIMAGDLGYTDTSCYGSKYYETPNIELSKNYKLDGESYLSHLTGDDSNSAKRNDISWHFPGYLGAGENPYRTKPVSVIRYGNYKLLVFLEDGTLELYNLIEDLGEKNNLASQMPDFKKELYDKLSSWRKDIKATMPSKNINGNNTPEPPMKKKKLS